MCTETFATHFLLQLNVINDQTLIRPHLLNQKIASVLVVQMMQLKTFGPKMNPTKYLQKSNIFVLELHEKTTYCANNIHNWAFLF